MLNVERYFSYRQSIIYALDYFDFRDAVARRRIFRKNAPAHLNASLSTRV